MILDIFRHRGRVNVLTTRVETGVLLVDWENLAGAIISQGYVVEARQVSDLWEYAEKVCGSALEAHMVAASFDRSIEEEMNRRFISKHNVSSNKEQADISLTVIAMDYWHRGFRRFVLVTGDQDFIPLIERLRQDNGSVTVVYGEGQRLARVFTQTLALPGLESTSIGEISQLRQQKKSVDCLDVLGLLELQRRGVILGGPDRSDRAVVLQGWGVLETVDESGYWSLIESVGQKVLRTDAAVRVGQEWKPESRYRTYLNLTTERIAFILGADYVLRVLTARRGGVHVANLCAGPFLGDNGDKVGEILNALKAIGLVRQNADGTYGLVGDDLRVGLLEELWRVHAALSAECYRSATASIKANRLEGLVSRGGLGQARDQSRDAGRIQRAVKYAAATGVIDYVAVDGARHVRATNSKLAEAFDRAYSQLYTAIRSRLNVVIPKIEIHDLMRSHDAKAGSSIFGYDDRDRDRILRILVQSRLAKYEGEGVMIFDSKWADAISVSRATQS